MYKCCCQVTSVVSDPVQPHRRRPTRLPRPWDSPGKNTGVGCHFLLQCRKVKNESEVTQSCPTLSDSMDRSLPGSSVHGISQARVLEWVAIAFSDVQMIGPQISWQLKKIRRRLRGRFSASVPSPSPFPFFPPSPPAPLPSPPFLPSSSLPSSLSSFLSTFSFSAVLCASCLGAPSFPRSLCFHQSLALQVSWCVFVLS